MMIKLIKLVGLSFVVHLCSARPHGFDDEGEMSVPRSPKIQGPPIVSVTFTSGAKLKTFVCNLEGTPTPTVLWLKDGKEVQGDVDPYVTSYNVQEGRMELDLKEEAYHDEKYFTGNFTCMAANFLGRVQKTFKIAYYAETTTVTEELARTGHHSIADDEFTVTNKVYPGSSRRPRNENVSSESTKVDDTKAVYHFESAPGPSLISSFSISPNLQT